MTELLWFYIRVITAQQGEEGGEVVTILHFHIFFPEVPKKVTEKKIKKGSTSTIFQYDLDFFFNKEQK